MLASKLKALATAGQFSGFLKNAQLAADGSAAILLPAWRGSISLSFSRRIRFSTQLLMRAELLLCWAWLAYRVQFTPSILPPCNAAMSIWDKSSL